MYTEKTYCKTEYVYRKKHTAKLNMYIEKNILQN